MTILTICMVLFFSLLMVSPESMLGDSDSEEPSQNFDQIIFENKKSGDVEDSDNKIYENNNIHYVLIRLRLNRT